MAESEESLYHYIPSKIGGIVGAIVFIILLAVHTWRLIRTRSWFCIPFVIGAAFEALGYATRAYGHSHPTELNPVIVQTLLILLAPILFAASVYMFLGRIIRASGESSLSMIRPTLLTKVFVGGDIVCFLVQALGAGILTNAKDKKALDLGKYIILGGLLLQLFLVAFFVVVAAVFHVRMGKTGAGQRAAMRWNWKKYLIMLYVVSLIITLRNIFRVVEYWLGEGNYLLVNEWPLYVFDALPMAIVLVICITWYVGDVLAKLLRGSSAETYIMMPGDQSHQGSNTSYQHGNTGYQHGNTGYQHGNTGYQHGNTGYQHGNTGWQPSNPIR
ncbi:RTA1 like protein-domain-containing protein [Dendryphion nanum]|uniref:RTA1 like protein-domain-containing protein n=1 Tax=Dendryphion nanum TaxID=256645 RepID=A0A9P9DYB0_9PLEO|nr:RTA1 like protein-domain-containing protein [Dendryphion nanum]